AEKTLRASVAAAIAGKHVIVEARAMTALVVIIGLRQARFAEAHDWALLAEAAATHGDAFVKGEVHRNLGRLLVREGKFEEARVEIEKCLALWEPAFDLAEYTIAGALTDLGNVYWSTGRYAEAAEKYQRSLRITEAALGADSPQLGTNLNNLGSVYAK